MKNGSISGRRNSNVEALKIIAVILIVINHTVMTVSKVGIVEYFPQGIANTVDLTRATTDLSRLILIFCRHFGAIGNCMFLIPSIWFLCQGGKTKADRVIQLLADTWLLSLIIAVAFWKWHGVSAADMIKSLFPTTFNINWYVTAYLLLYLFHEYLNLIISNVGRKQHFMICIALSILYMGFGTLRTSFFYYTRLMFFITAYFVVAYLQKYRSRFVINRKNAAIMLAIGIVGLICMIGVTDVLGLHFRIFRNKMWFWAKTSNPVTFLIALGAFGLAMGKTASKRTVDYISRLSLYIYIVHEHLLMRKIGRPLIWIALNKTVSGNLVLRELLFALAILAISSVLAFGYRETLHRLVIRASPPVSAWIRRWADTCFILLQKSDGGQMN